MGGVVGCNYGYSTRFHCVSKGGAVGDGLDGGVALDCVAGFRVVLVAEPEVMNADFGGYVWHGAVGRNGVKQSRFLAGGEMEHVQTGVVARREFDGTSGGLYAGFGASHQRVD